MAVSQLRYVGMTSTVSLKLSAGVGTAYTVVFAPDMGVGKTAQQENTDKTTPAISHNEFPFFLFIFFIYLAGVVGYGADALTTN